MRIASQIPEKCLATGMDGYNSKPVAPAKLLTALEGRGGVLDAEMIDEIRQLGEGTDGSEVRLLLHTFLVTIENTITELGLALQEGDACHVGQITHSIRGSSSTFGARGVGDLAGHIERLASEGRIEDAADAYRDMRGEVTAAAEALPLALGLIDFASP